MSEPVAQRAINLAQDALLDAMLEKNPDDVRVLTLRGTIAEVVHEK